jgi:hypothetical protein
LAIAICAAFIAAVAVIAWSRGSKEPIEPEYKGKKLRTWIKLYQFRPSDSKDTEREDAIRKIGTNAIPTLVWWLDHAPTRSRDVAVKLWGHALRLVGQPVDTTPPESETLSNLALTGLAVLGADASSASGILGERLAAHRREQYGERYARALASIGPMSARALIEALADKRSCNRDRLIDYLASAVQIGGEQAKFVPSMLAFATDKNEAVAEAAMQASAGFATNASQIIEAMTNFMCDPRYKIRAAAVSYLGMFKSESRPAVEAVRSLLSDTNSDVRVEATTALDEIERDVQTNAALTQPSP